MRTIAVASTLASTQVTPLVDSFPQRHLPSTDTLTSTPIPTVPCPPTDPATSWPSSAVDDIPAVITGQNVPRVRGPSMTHDEWKKSLPDGRVAHFVYDEVAEVCAATLKLGELVRSRSSLKGPLTREQVEELFAHELRLAARHSAGS